MKITESEEMNIIISGGILRFYPKSILTKTELEAGRVYTTIVDHQNQTVDLTETSPLSLPSRVYDFDKDFRDQILKTLRHPNSNSNIGVLLAGYKGNGKSVIAKQLAIESGLPIVVISSQIPKVVDLSNFLGQIKQDYVLIIDEFEKLFRDDFNAENANHTQESFLSIFDGAMGFSHKRLVILTSNGEINDKFINRPSRVRYFKTYNYMPKVLFEEIAKDKLINQDYLQDLEDNLDVPSCTIDLLTTIIDEINIQDKPYSSFKDYFNNKPREVIYDRYKKTLDGRFEFFDMVRSNREIGVEHEYAKNIFGWDIQVLQSDGETIFYEVNEEIQDPKGSLDSDGEIKEIEVKTIYKAIKQNWSKNTMVF